MKHSTGYQFRSTDDVEYVVVATRCDRDPAINCYENDHYVVKGSDGSRFHVSDDFIDSVTAVKK